MKFYLGCFFAAAAGVPVGFTRIINGDITGGMLIFLLISIFCVALIMVIREKLRRLNLENGQNAQKRDFRRVNSERRRSLKKHYNDIA